MAIGAIYRVSNTTKIRSRSVFQWRKPHIYKHACFGWVADCGAGYLVANQSSPQQVIRALRVRGCR